MVTAVVLAQADIRRIPETAQEMLDVPEVAEVYSVAGEFDLVAMVRVREYEQMAEVVTERLARIPGVTRTVTLMAFRCYSRKDLERLWGLGMEDEAALHRQHSVPGTERGEETSGLA